MLELDLLLHAFFEQRFMALDAQAQQAFVTLLGYPDQTLQRWLLGDGEAVAAEVRDIVQRIRTLGAA